MHRYTWKTFSWELWMLLVALVFCLPLYLLVSTALKPSSQIFTSPLSFPSHPDFGNFGTAWRDARLGEALLSSLIITVGAVLVLIVVGSLCAYAIARRPGRLSNTLYILFLLGIIVPFQVSVIPLYVMLREVHLIGSYLGMIVLWTGIAMPLTVFLYTSFVRALPRDYEEASTVDGASTMRTFFRVVFPLLRPVTGTVAILTGLFIWNNFFVALIFLSGSPHQTLPVAVYSFVGEYVTQWNLVFATVIIALIPMVIFFIVAQKQLIRGFSGGIRG
jgi:raffinose/stachyose/melibiose transport system permease protein